MFGHSIGEYVAAHLSGVLSLDDALSLVATRGRLMQACAPGAMAAIHLSESELLGILPDTIEVAAVNGPSLCAVGGPSDVLGKWLAGLADRGVQSVRLKTSHAFHSAMMQPACAALADAVAKVSLSPPKIPYVSNLTGTWITAEQATSPGYYAAQLRHTVQFHTGIRTLLSDPTLALLEVGPGTALTTMARLNEGSERTNLTFSSLPQIGERRSEAAALLQAAGRLWGAGVGIDWRELHGTEAPRRVPLPTYPFERQRYWVDSPGPVREEPASPTTDVAQWTYAPTWTRDVSLSLEKPEVTGTWIVLSELGPLADTLIDSLRRAGANVVLAEIGSGFAALEERHYRVRLAQSEDMAELMRRVATSVGGVTGAIYLCGPQRKISSEWTSDYLVPVVLAEHLQSATAPGAGTTLLVASFGAQSVLDEPVRDPSASLAIGPVLVLPTEVPGLTMRAVDFDVPLSTHQIAATAQALVLEAAAADEERLVAWRGGRRWRRRYERIAVPTPDPGALPLKQHGVYLITGGLGGIGLTLAQWLARRASARLILTARTEVPPRDEWDRWLAEGSSQSRIGQVIRQLRDIEACGAEIITAAAAAADFDQMKEAVDQARMRWGEIDGVIHAAGIAGNGRLAFLKSPEDVKAVISPKVDGLAVLVRLLGEKPLDFVALMSSINAVVGAAGASDYAAANLYLDAFQESDACPKAWRKVTAFDWGAWRDVGMAAALVVPEARRAQWEEHLRYGIPPHVGVDLFERGLCAKWGRIVVTPYDLSAPMRPVRPFERETADQESDASKTTTPATASIPIDGSSTELVLAKIWSELLGLPQVDVHNDFFQLGGHSLLATRMMARIEDNFGARISLRDVFDAPTVEQLSRRIDAAKVSGAPAAVQDDEEREEMVF